MKNIPAIVSGIYACKSSSSFQRVLNVIITNVISPNIIPARKHTRTISIIFVCHRPSTKKKNISHCTNIKFSITDFFSICDKNPQKTADLVIFTEEIRNVKLHFCAVSCPCLICQLSIGKTFVSLFCLQFVPNLTYIICMCHITY